MCPGHIAGEVFCFLATTGMRPDCMSGLSAVLWTTENPPFYGIRKKVAGFMDDYSDRFSIVSAPFWVVGFLLLINSVKSVFSALLEFHDVMADDILCNFINCKNAHFVHTPPPKQL